MRHAMSLINIIHEDLIGGKHFSSFMALSDYKYLAGLRQSMSLLKEFLLVVIKCLPHLLIPLRIEPYKNKHQHCKRK